MLIFKKNPISRMQRFSGTLFISLMILLVILSGCTSPSTPADPAPEPAAAASSATTPSASADRGANSLTLKVGDLTSGSQLPDINTCKGASESPGVAWDGIPEGTKSLVLILDDPDAPAGTFTHWILYNIPPKQGSLGPAQTNAKVLANGAQQGDSSAGSRGYYPVCPPIGSTHRYVFSLYAVDMDIAQPTANRESIDWALDGHTIAKTELVTTFTR